MIGLTTMPSENPEITEETSATPTEIMVTLSSEMRVEVLAILAKAKKCVTDLAAELELHVSATSHALKTLQSVGLVRHETVHKQHIYSLTNAVAVSFHDSMMRIHVGTTTGRMFVERKNPLLR